MHVRDAERVPRSDRTAADANVDEESLSGAVARRARSTLSAWERLAEGLGTGVLALVLVPAVVIALAAACVGLEKKLAPGVLRAVRSVADRERIRLSRWCPEVIGAGTARTELAALWQDVATRREIAWLVWHGFAGSLVGAVGIGLPLNAVRDLTFPLWWWLLPAGVSDDWLPFWTVDDQASAAVVGFVGLGWAVTAVTLAPALAWIQAWPGRHLLGPAAGADLVLRVAELSAARAGALDAHVLELRRIERSLHDGTQNRLVAVTVLVGAARRALERDPASVDGILLRVQEAAELALAEMRSVSRSILPPVLSDRSLADALTSLVASGSLLCRLDVDVPDRCAASVEATAYFTVAEALTNATRHSRANAVQVDVRACDGRLQVAVTDNGCGGAHERRGSGLAGIRQRIEAHDGTFTLSSPLGGPTRLEAELPCGS